MISVSTDVSNKAQKYTSFPIYWMQYLIKFIYQSFNYNYTFSALVEIWNNFDLIMFFKYYIYIINEIYYLHNTIDLPWICLYSPLGTVSL